MVLDARAASSLGLEVGDRISALGREWRVSGLTSDMTNITNTVSYVRFEDFAQARKLRATASFLLVKVSGDPEKVAQRIQEATGLTALTQEEFSAQERRIVQDMAADLMRIMTVAAFLIGLAVVALVLYSATLSRLREVGVMKALGSSNLATALVVLKQAAWTVLPAVAAAALATFVLGVVLDALGSDTSIALTFNSVARTGIAAIVLGAFGALAPLAKVVRVDPISVFRR